MVNTLISVPVLISYLLNLILQRTFTLQIIPTRVAKPQPYSTTIGL
jgi:hypothetical protein